MYAVWAPSRPSTTQTVVMKFERGALHRERELSNCRIAHLDRDRPALQTLSLDCAGQARHHAADTLRRSSLRREPWESGRGA